MGSEARAGAAPADRLPLFALLGANAISLVGNQLTAIAVPWFVLVTTGSAAKTGLVAFCTILPAILGTFFGGAIVDRLSYRRASIVADLASGITVALIPLLYLTVGLAFWQLLALVFLGALLDAPGATARSALLPDLAGLAGIRLERTSAADAAIRRAALLLGSPLAGLLVAVVGPTRVLWVDAATFAVSAALLALAVPAPRAAAEHAEERESARYLDELLDGLRFIRRDRLILALVLTVMLTNLLDAASGSVIIPVYARQVYGSALDFGLMVAAFGGGAMAGTLAFGAVGHRLPRRATFIGAFILTGTVKFAILALFPPLGIVLATLALTSVGAGPLNPIIDTLKYERVPEDLRGRVFDAMTAGMFVAMPLGVLLGGYLLEWVGLRATLLGVFACYLAVTLGMLVIPAFRDMDAPPTDDEPRPGPAGWTPPKKARR